VKRAAQATTPAETPASEAETAVIAQDPRYGGGFRSMAAAFWEGAQGLGRNPRLYYLSRGRMASLYFRSLHVRVHPERQEPFSGTAFPSLLPELDAVNQLTGGLRIARRIRVQPFLWVVASTATYGYGASRANRPYACWLATGQRSEWAARRKGLPPSRRLALMVNAPALRLIERRVLRRAAAVYSISPFASRTLAESAALPLERIRVLPIPVDLELFSPEPDERWLERLDRPTIAFVGRANDPRKNVRLLLDAFPAIRAAVPRARLRAIGEAPALHVREQGGPGVEWLGPIDSVAEVLREAALLVLPSLQEGFGIVVAEAMAAGVPVVVTPCGGPEDIVRDSRAGVLLASFRPDELAARVVGLLGDRERLLRMRHAGRAYVAREHSAEQLRRALAEAFAELESLA
jgi:glycosyltransferase involved in cell wall biosynthesis